MTTEQDNEVDIETKIDAIIIMLNIAEEVESIMDWYNAYQLPCTLAVCYRKGYITGLTEEGKEIIANAFSQYQEVTGFTEERLLEMTVGAI